jgi:hypothetical protein
MWRDSVEKLGFAISPHGLAPPEVMRLLEDCDELMGRRSRAGIRHALGHPPIRNLAHDRRLLGVAQEILGRDAFPFRATLFDKSQDANWLVVWHQDTALPLRERQELPVRGRSKRT